MSGVVSFFYEALKDTELERDFLEPHTSEVSEKGVLKRGQQDPHIESRTAFTNILRIILNPVCKGKLGVRMHLP